MFVLKTQNTQSALRCRIWQIILQSVTLTEGFLGYLRFQEISDIRVKLLILGRVLTMWNSRFKCITTNPLSLNSNWLHFQFMKVQIRISSPSYQDTFFFCTSSIRTKSGRKLTNKCWSFCTSKRIFSLVPILPSHPLCYYIFTLIPFLSVLSLEC